LCTAVWAQGGKEQSKYDTDGETIFRQEARAHAQPCRSTRRLACAPDPAACCAAQSYFQWAFGVAEPGCYGVLNLDTGLATLLVPRHKPEYAVWMGTIRSLDWFKARYGVDAVAYADNMAATLAPMGPAWLHVLDGTNSDSGTEFPATDLPSLAPGLDFCFENGAFTALHEAMTALRVHKSDAELAVMRYASRVTSDAHVAAMRIAKHGLREYHLEAAFLHAAASRGGCRLPAYTPIAAAGRHGAALHYGHAGAPNNGPLRDGDLALCDFGAEYHCYAADVTT
jgi:Xaa-Pro dipeptidase